MSKNTGRLNRSCFAKAHSDTVFVQPIFPHLAADEIRKDTFAYPPCWGILDPGMAVEKHQHPMPEFYVFAQGKGQMVLGSDTFDVAAGMSVNIPVNVDHAVVNAESAIEPLVWVSIGLKVGAA